MPRTITIFPPKKTTNRQHSIQTKKYGTISNSQMQSKHIQSEPKTTKTTKHMADESNASTSTKHTNNNIPNELLQFQRHKNNTSRLQNSKINTNKEKNPNPVYRITVPKKTLLPTQYQQLQHHYVANFNND